MAVLLEDLAQRQHRRGPAGPQLFERAPPLHIVGGIETGIGHTDTEHPSGDEHPATVTEHRHAVLDRHVLEHVFEESGLGRLVGEGQWTTEVPGDVGVGSDQVDVHPAVDVVTARTEMQPEPRLLAQGGGLPASSSGEGVRGHLLRPETNRGPDEWAERVGEGDGRPSGARTLGFAHLEVLAQAHG